MLAGSLALLLGLAAPPATETISLTYEAPETCPERHEVQRAIDARLGGAPTRPLAVAVSITRADERRWRLSLGIRDEGQGSDRVIEASTCWELVDAAAWLIALAVNPEVAPPDRAAVEAAPAVPEPPALPDAPEKREPAVTPEVAARGTSSAAASTPAPVTDERAPTDARPRGGERNERAPRLLLAPAFGAVYGPAPRFAPALAVALALDWHPARLQLEFTYALPITLADREEPSYQARVELLTGSARGCGVLGSRAGRVRAPLCAGVSAGATRGRGQGDQVVPSVGYAPWLALDASAGVEVWVHERVGLSLVARGLVSLTAPAFHIEPIGRDLLNATPAGFSGWGRVVVRIR